MTRVSIRGVFLAAIIAALAAATHGGDDVVSVVVLHRHGARLPQPPSNVSAALCGTAAECGQLTTEGMDMLFQLGQWVRETYPRLPVDDPASVPVSGTLYNPDVVVSHSDDIPRTLQSSAAFVSGLFAGPNANSTARPVVPATRGVSQADAKDLLVWTGWPALVVHSGITSPAFLAMMSRMIAPMFTQHDYGEFGRELGISAICGSGGDPFGCALIAQDVITCARSNMPAAEVAKRFPALAGQYHNLTRVMELYNAVSMYNASKPFDRAIGTKGFLLANSIIDFFAADAPAPLLELSGHDVTLMPFAETIGNVSLINPGFGGAFVLELLSTRYVRLRYGQPEQLYGTSHKYTFNYFSLKCNTEAGVTYDAPREQGCPLADWGRYVATRGPESPAGICYIDAADTHRYDCAPGNSSTDRANQPPADPVCATYRRSCPQWACLAPEFDTSRPPTTYLDPVTFACRSLPHAGPAPSARQAHTAADADESPLARIPPPALIGLSVVATLLVIIVAAVIALCCTSKGGVAATTGPDSRVTSTSFAGSSAPHGDYLLGLEQQHRAIAQSDASSTVGGRDGGCCGSSLLRRVLCCCCGPRGLRDSAHAINGTEPNTSFGGARGGPADRPTDVVDAARYRVIYGSGGDASDTSAVPSSQLDVSSATVQTATASEAGFVPVPLPTAAQVASGLGPLAPRDPNGAARPTGKQPPAQALVYARPLSPRRRLSFGASEASQA